MRGAACRAAAVCALAIASCRDTPARASRDTPVETVTARRTDPPRGSSPDAPGLGERAGSLAGTIALPRFASGEIPAYPEISRRLEEQGTVELCLELLHDGTVEALRVSQSSGYPRLDQAALEAARTWRFNPRTGGAKVEELRYRFTFRLVDPR